MEFRQFAKDIWIQICGSFIWWLATTILSGAVMTAAIGILRALFDEPFTIGSAAIIFVISLILLGLLYGFYLYRKSHAVQVSINPVGQYSLPVILLSVLLAFMAVWNMWLQKRIHHLEAKMIRYVVPRELTSSQIEAFGNYLKGNSKPQEVRIKYILGDSESENYANDFASAFKAGNWYPHIMAINPISISCSHGPSGPMCQTELQQMINRLEGVNIEQTGPNPPSPTTVEEKLHPQKQAYSVISEALRTAGIRGIGSGYSYNNDPLNTVTVFIGLRKRDKWAVIPQRDDRPKGISDDDF